MSTFTFAGFKRYLRDYPVPFAEWISSKKGCITEFLGVVPRCRVPGNGLDRIQNSDDEERRRGIGRGNKKSNTPRKEAIRTY